MPYEFEPEEILNVIDENEESYGGWMTSTEICNELGMQYGSPPTEIKRTLATLTKSGDIERQKKSEKSAYQYRITREVQLVSDHVEADEEPKNGSGVAALEDGKDNYTPAQAALIEAFQMAMEELEEAERFVISDAEQKRDMLKRIAEWPALHPDVATLLHSVVADLERYILLESTHALDS